MIPYMLDSLHSSDLYIAQRRAVPSSSTEDQIIEKLSMLMTLQIKVFMVHVSHVVASHLLSNAKKSGMISEGCLACG